MKSIFNSLMEAFKPIFNREIILFSMKCILVTVIPLFLMLFIASRITPGVSRGIVVLIGFIWFYVATLISLGIICRVIFLSQFTKTRKYIEESITFSRNFAPAYIVIPTVIVIIIYIIWLIFHFILYSALIPYLGEILLGVIFSPLVVISIILFLVFSSAIYITPSIIAAEESGISRVLKRLFHIVKSIPIHFFICFLSGMIFTFIVFCVSFGLLSIGVGILFPIVTFVLKSHLVDHFMAVGGTFITGFEVYGEDLTWTSHIFALLFYLGAGLLFSLAMTMPVIYMCSSSLYIYRLIYHKMEKRERRVEDG